MIAASPELSDLIDRARRFAALSGSFDPQQALPDGKEHDRQTIVSIAAALAGRCDTNPDEGGGWLLRTGDRRHILRTLREAGKLEEAIRERRGLAETSRETEDLLAAIAGEHPFAPDDVARDIADPQSAEWLRRIVVALDRAGDEAPAGGLLQQARAALARTERETRRRHLHERGFFGRDGEKAALLEFLAQSFDRGPVKAAFVSGLPGIGKSALIEEVANALTDRFNGLNVRLDFDRAGLDVIDVRGLTMEVARQLGERLGADGQAILDERLEAASYQPGEDASSSSQQAIFPTALADEMGRSVRASGRPVLFILDTLEVLRARGNEHPRRLFEWIDTLVRHGLGPVRVLAAGRGEALDSCRERIGSPNQLEGLDPESAKQLLERMKVPPGDRDAVARIANGNPLVLRLAAEIALEHGRDSLPDEVIAKEAAAAFLYRFLLSRIEEPDLRRLAHPGLVLRRLSAGLLREVLAPELGMPDLSEEESRSIFETLAREHWLVVPDPEDPEFVIHRSDMRLALLPLLYSSEPKLCARIDAAAVRWFGRRPDPASQLDAAYHRLQRMRSGRGGRPLIDRQLAHRFDFEMLAELPDRARDLVLRTTGGRTEKFRQDSAYSGGRDDESLALELSNLIERQDWAEGQYLVGQAVQDGGFDARSLAADAVRAFYWRAGRWTEARRLLAERDQLGGDDRDLPDLPKHLALARLEMRAELGRPGADALGFAHALLAPEVSGSMLSLSRHGALAFRLLARSSLQLTTELKRGADPVAAAFEHWTGRTGYAERQAVDLARERMTARGAVFGPDGEGMRAQLIAAHSPYAPVASNLATQAQFHWLVEEAGKAERVWCELGPLYEPGLARQPGPTKANPIAGIAGLGLFAEWVDLLGFTRRDPNLRAIGRAAERWRQTIAGSWRYGRAPTGWASPGGLDCTLKARLIALDRNPDRVSVSLINDLLRSGRGVDLVERRLARSIRSAVAGADGDPAGKRRGGAELFAIAAALSRSRVPAALVPPVAVLVHRRQLSAGR